MQRIKLMLAKLQLPFESDLNLMHNLLHNVLPKYQFTRDKLNTFRKELENFKIIKQIGSYLQDKPVFGTTYLNPLINIPKGDFIRRSTS